MPHKIASFLYAITLRAMKITRIHETILQVEEKEKSAIFLYTQIYSITYKTSNDKIKISTCSTQMTKSGSLIFCASKFRL